MATLDLHVHTTASDGHLTPEEVVREAKALGLKAISITDHDTTEGLDKALLAGKKENILVIPGIELSSEIKEKEVHILGYFMNYNEQAFQDELLKFRSQRKERAKSIVEKLNELGYNITFNDVLNFSKSATVGRPHIAQALIAKGKISSISEAFEKLLARGKPAYVPRFKLTPQEAVKLIKKNFGIPVMAHPGLAQIDNVIPELVEAGLMGLEVYHPEHDLQDIIKYQTIAKAHKMLITGGSDFHGTSIQTKCTIGVPEADFEIVTSLLKAKENMKC